ncbi:MAG TPA: heme exporter protein CcmD [Dongiaceae bacterium]|nr:heme exporter protein CcmD [Dongiaceae bacterium]
MGTLGSGGFLAMGGDAAFVWPAYGVAALMLAGFAWLSWRRLRSAERALERIAEADPAMSDDA